MSFDGPHNQPHHRPKLAYQQALDRFTSTTSFGNRDSVDYMTSIQNKSYWATALSILHTTPYVS